MALRVWLPLNGNLNNQGLSGDATISGSPSYASGGKIADKYLNTGNMISIHVPTIKGSKICSFSFWAYVVSSTITSDWTLIARIDDQGTNAGSNMRFEVCPKSNYNGIYCFSNHNNGNYGLTNGCITSPAGGYYDQWVHFCFTSDGTTFTRYMNGVKIGTCAYNGEATFNGDFRLANNNKCYKQDVRIYDHCLSPKEVKEISKGLCLHYKLAGPGQTNLLNTSQYYSGGQAGGSVSLNGNEMTISSPGGQWDGYAFAYDHLKNSTNYILSFKTQKVSGTLTKIGGHDSGLVTSWELDGVTQSVPYSSTVSVADDFTMHKVVLHITTTSSSKGPIYFQVNRGNTTVCTQKFWDIKLTEGNQQVGPWCPAETELGYDNNIEDDCSGYRNNGTKSGTITWDIDSPRYITSYKFNTGIDYIKSAFSLSMSELSCSFWVKPNSSNGGYSIIASNYNNPPSGFWLAINTEGSGVWFYNGSYVAGRSLLTNNVWHHCVFTFKNGIGTWYVNGTSVVSTNISNRGTSLNINNLIVGNSYTGTSWNTKNYGNISDFRVYATALSAADILELYEVGGAIDSHYNSYVYEYIIDDSNEYLNSQGISGVSDLEETDENTKWLSTGKIESNNFYEI